jgi:histidyl-tRNA synthetase
MNDYQRPTGTQDILPTPRAPHETPETHAPDAAYWRWIEATARSVAARYGYQPVEIPVYEHTDLFARGVGAGTDIVEKEMFTFRPRPESDSLTLRPEFTAGFARAYLQNGMGSWPQPVKVYTIGPVFRYERPQANRFRQHSQFNCECLGEADPLADFEIMAMLWDYFSALGMKGLRFQLNTIGAPEARRAYVSEQLVPWLEARRDALPEIDRERLAKNPLRVFDSKEEKTRAMLAEAPLLADHIDEESRAHFAALRAYLDDNGLAYTIDPTLVRGLDYYARTVFEIHVEGIGAQSALCGGGRYDGLIELLGGTPTPGVGFGAGIERAIAVLRLMDIRPPALPAPETFVVYFDEPTKQSAVALCTELRRAGIGSASDYGLKNTRKQMKAASRSGARFALIIGDEELGSGTVMVKDLARGEQGLVARSEVVAELRARLEV